MRRALPAILNPWYRFLFKLLPATEIARDHTPPRATCSSNACDRTCCPEITRATHKHANSNTRRDRKWKTQILSSTLRGLAIRENNHSDILKSEHTRASLYINLHGPMELNTSICMMRVNRLTQDQWPKAKQTQELTNNYAQRTS